MSGRQILVDADVLVYTCAFAAQKTRYNVQVTDTASPLCLDGTKQFPDAKTRDAWMKEQGLTKKQIVSTPEVEIFSQSVCVDVAKSRLHEIKAACGGGEMELFLTGEGNFRNAYAVTKPYKDKRPPKPHNYDFVRQWFFDRKNCTNVSGIEADDAIGIRQTELAGEGIIATIDKDLNMIEGRHYNWGAPGQKPTRYKMGHRDCMLWFMAQCCAGDPTDNIPGIPGIGTDTALKELRKVESTATRWQIVKGLFEEHYGADGDAKLREFGILVWMQRLPDQRWTPSFFEQEIIPHVD
ncbi:MAG: hypothetical protein M0P95_17850 [Sulfuritalea sp.]|jgi:hypothetical protein|nr:hypothetical protein [Sulfuritalea sp.]